MHGKPHFFFFFHIPLRPRRSVLPLPKAAAGPRSHSIRTLCKRRYISSTAAAVQRQPCSKLSTSCQSRCTCVVVAQQQAEMNHNDNMFTSNETTMKHTSHRTLYYVSEAYNSSKTSGTIGPYVYFEYLCSFFSCCDAPGIWSESHPEGEPCSTCKCRICSVLYMACALPSLPASFTLSYYENFACRVCILCRSNGGSGSACVFAPPSLPPFVFLPPSLLIVCDCIFYYGTPGLIGGRRPV